MYKFLWILLCLITLIPTLMGSDGYIVTTYIMLLLGFPLSLIVNFCLSTIMSMLQPEIPAMLADCILWFLVSSIGYYQWFILTPKLYRKWKDWR